MVLKMNKPDVERDTCTMMDEIKMMSHLSHENVIRCISSSICWSFPRALRYVAVVNMGFDFVLASKNMYFSSQISWNLRR